MYSGGGQSQIKSEILLYETARTQGPYGYYHMMSGTDLPIKRIDFINDFFEKNNGKEFLTFFDRRPEEIIERIEYRYFFVDFRENSLFRHLNAISLNLQKHFHLLRRLPEGVVLKKGEGWCSLTSKAVDFLLSNKPFIENIFLIPLLV